jgi:hypothetical protein
MSVGEGLAALKYFRSLKKGASTFDFPSHEPSTDLLRPLDRYDHPLEKKTNTRPWSFFWQQIQNSTFLHIGAWNLYSRVLWYAESYGVTFWSLDILGVSPPFQKLDIFSGS